MLDMMFEYILKMFFIKPMKELAFLQENNFDMIGLGFLAARYVETVRPMAKIINENKKICICCRWPRSFANTRIRS